MQRPVRRLSDLASLKSTLEREAAERAEAERAQRAAAVLQERETHVFRDAVGAVEPLRTSARAQHPRTLPEPVAHQRKLDEAAAFLESISDDFDVDTVLDVDEQVSWERPGVAPDVVARLRRGHWIVQAELDLHGARVGQAREMLGEFLRDAQKRRQRCVRVIHGKGHGSIGKQPVLKGKVKLWLSQKDEVIAWCQAREHDGGGGVLIVLLRPS